MEGEENLSDDESVVAEENSEDRKSHIAYTNTQNSRHRLTMGLHRAVCVGVGMQDYIPVTRMRRL